MFTGLIEAVCVVKSVRPSTGGALLTVDLSHLANECKIGDSIAINGVCLTISELKPALKRGAEYLAPQLRPREAGTLAEFEISPETLRRSTLGRLKTGSLVNVERAVKATDRFGGHFVQGHIDGTATIKTIKRRGQFADIQFEAEPKLLSQMVVKGSVAVDGISLTIAAMDLSSFSTAIIPQTLKETTLGTAKVGDAVNIETDIIVKVIASRLDKMLPQRGELTVERLKELGF